ncbi:MAG: hypothetical protein K6F80_05795 [Oscillospiraceae bacterium]|nr:hypothetical protein [Oscillospiraceae bacterium]
MQKNEFLQSLTEQVHLSDEAVKRLAEQSCTNQKGTVRHDLTGTVLPAAEESPAAPQTEEEAALRREKALRQVELMLVQKQPHTEQRPFYRRHSYYAPPKPRQAVSDNRLDLTELLAQYKLSPEAQERLAKIRAGASKGTVRPHLMTRMGSIAAAIALFVIGMTLENFPYMNVMKPTFLILALLCLVWAYYVHTWKLEYDSESDFVRYHSMFHGTNLYAMQELMLFSVDPVPEKTFPLSFLGMLDPRQYLVIHLPEFVINIPLLFSKEIMGQLIELEGFEGAGDFCRCLRQFEPGTVKQPTVPPQEERAVKLTKPAEPVPTKKPTPQPVPISEAELPAKPVMPERGSAFPDPTQKPEVDVDALFNQVLREHGKLK